MEAVIQTGKLIIHESLMPTMVGGIAEYIGKYCSKDMDRRTVISQLQEGIIVPLTTPFYDCLVKVAVAANNIPDSLIKFGDFLRITERKYMAVFLNDDYTYPEAIEYFKTILTYMDSGLSYEDALYVINQDYIEAAKYV